jgi:hypothetical protein
MNNKKKRESREPIFHTRNIFTLTGHWACGRLIENGLSEEE